MVNLEAELEQQLKEAGKRLSRPLDSIDELLSLLDQIEKLLSKVNQSPTKSMLDALKPSMNALVQESLLKHSDVDVKVAVASCVSDITRITAPDAPYDDDQMRDIFQLIISSFKDIADQSSRSYIKRASILETVSEVRSFLIMFDLECDTLIVEMFEHFLRSVRDYHHESIYPSMESIMVLVLEESEEISVEMLKPLLARLKKYRKGVLPVARRLAEGVLLKSADKLRPYLMPAIVSLGDTLDEYTEVVASVCEGKTATVEHKYDIASGVQQKTVAAKEVKSPQRDDPEDDEATGESDAESQKQAGTKAAAAKGVKLPPKDDSGDDEATGESDAKPQKPTGKKAAAAKGVKLPPKYESEDDEATSESDAKPQKPTGKKAAAAKGGKLPPKYDSEDDEATSESDAKPQKPTGKKAAAVESEDDEATSESDAPPPKKTVSKSTKQPDKKSKLSGKKSDVGKLNAKKQKQTGKKVTAKVEDSDSEVKPPKSSVKKGQKRKAAVEEEEESDSENKPLQLATKKGSSKKKNDGRKRESGKNATANDQVKAMSSDDEMDYSLKSAAKSAKRKGSTKDTPVNSAKRKRSAVKDKVSDTIKYDESLVGSNVKIWCPEDKMYFEGVIESFDAAKKKYKVLYVNGEKETLDLKTQKWEILKEYSVCNEGVLTVIRKLGEGLLSKPAEKLKTCLIPAIMGDTFDKYPKVVASECKLVKESKNKAHQAAESNLTTTSSDCTGQVFKEGDCREEVDYVMGNQEASLDLEPSKKSEKEVINQESLNKKDTDGTNKHKESNPKDQASKKRGKEDDTVVKSPESRCNREISDGSAKKSRVCGVAGGSSLVPPPVACSKDATLEGRDSDRTTSGHIHLGDKNVMRYPSRQMSTPGASTQATEERVKKMGRLGVVDRLQGMANESAALFSHAAESIHALELDNSELERQLNEFVLRDKGYHEKITVLEKEVSDLKAQDVQMKLTWEARVVDADRRAAEVERRFAEAKREMEVESFKLKKQLDEYVLCDQGYKEKIRMLEREVADLKSLVERRALEAETKLAVAKRKMAKAEGTIKAALASFAL